MSNEHEMHILPMSETYLTQTVLPHKAALVNIAVHAHYASLARILPQSVVALIGKYRLVFVVLGYHELIVVHFATKMAVVEIGACIE